MQFNCSTTISFSYCAFDKAVVWTGTAWAIRPAVVGQLRNPVLDELFEKEYGER